MKWHVRKNRALAQKLFALTVVIEKVAWIPESERLTVTKLAPDFWRGVAHYGFMQPPDIPALMRRTPAYDCNLQLDDITYYVGRETIVPAEEKGSRHLSRPEVWMFSAMVRNAMHTSDFFKLPTDCVVEIGRQIAI
jgi:KUP system potassium uptake protein